MYYYKHQNANASVIAVTNTATNIFDLLNTAGSTTLGNAGYPALVNGIDITPEDGDIRILFNNTPTASKGQLLSSGTTYMFRNIPLANMKLIRTGGSNVSCSVALGTCKDDECSTAVCYESSSTISGTVTVQGDVANDSPDSGNPLKIGGKALAEEGVAVTSGDRVDGGFDLYGNQRMVGNIAHDTADRGNPIKIGGKAASSQPTAVTAGDRVNQAYDLNGGIVPAGFNWTNASTSTTEFSPLDTHYTVTSLVNATNVAQDTYYYPDATGVLMTNNTQISAEYVLDAGGGGTATMTIEATIDGTNFVDITKTAYDLAAASVNQTYVSTGTAVTGITDLEDIHVVSVRYKVVVATADADAIRITIKRASL